MIGSNKLAQLRSNVRMCNNNSYLKNLDIGLGLSHKEVCKLRNTPIKLKPLNDINTNKLDELREETEISESTDI